MENKLTEDQLMEIESNAAKRFPFPNDENNNPVGDNYEQGLRRQGYTAAAGKYLLQVKYAEKVSYETSKANADMIGRTKELEDKLEAAKLALKEIYTGTDFPLLAELKRRQQLILSEPNGIVRETMIQNILIDL